MTELNLTMSLGVGGVNVARDNATVNMLKADFAGGIVQNMKNLAAVSCPLGYMSEERADFWITGNVELRSFSRIWDVAPETLRGVGRKNACGAGYHRNDQYQS